MEVTSLEQTIPTFLNTFSKNIFLYHCSRLTEVLHYSIHTGFKGYDIQ